MEGYFRLVAYPQDILGDVIATSIVEVAQAGLDAEI